MGPDLHAESDYGDESQGRTPWELFSEEDALRALHLAEEAMNTAVRISEAYVGPDQML